MIRLLIVDDEPLVRYGIRHAIPWQQHGVEVVSEAGNGRIAMEMVSRHHPDVVLCDILMPMQDGISFIRELHAILPDIRVIMVTGHGDQKYMMEAIHNSVLDYLLKPASPEQILSAVMKAKEEIDKERVSRLEQQCRDELFTENLALLREHFVNNLLNGHLSAERIAENTQLLSLSLGGPCYALVLATYAQDGALVLAQQCETIFSAFDPLISQLPDSTTVVSVLNLPRSVSAAELAVSIPNAIPGLSGSMVFSGCCDNLCALSTLYPAAKLALERAFWYSNENLIAADQIPLSVFPTDEIAKLEYRIFDAIQNGDTQDIRRTASFLLDRLYAFKPDRKLLQSLLNRIVQTVNMICRNRHPTTLPLPDACGYEAFREAFLSMCCQPKCSDGTFGSGQVGRVLRFIEHNYNLNISLESIAAQLYLSPTYLSRLLNEKTEFGFYGWLHYFRIEKAKELLTLTEMKHYEIAQTVGYNTYKVFSEHFQEIAGCTASEFRLRCRAKDGDDRQT